MMIQYYRSRTIFAFYGILDLTFWIFTAYRGTFSASVIIFHLMLILSGFISHQIMGTKNTTSRSQISLPEFILKSFREKKFEQIDKNRKHICFDCMTVDFEK